MIICGIFLQFPLEFLGQIGYNNLAVIRLIIIKARENAKLR